MFGYWGSSTETPLQPSRPLAGRVGRVRAARADGVGGLHVLPACGRPPPLTPPRHALRARGEGNRRLRVSFGGFAMIALALVALFSPAHADDYPSRPITLVVPFPAGGTNTIMARIVADKLADALGQQVIVDNRGGGAGGTIGTRQVAHAEPDGYTILLAFTSTLSTAPSMYANLGYDVRKDFAPIGLISSSPSVLSVHPGLPARSVAELIAMLKGSAEPFQYG